MMQKQEILNYIDSFKDLNILAIGETIIDIYQYGKTLGRAGKFPVVTFQGETEEVYDGGILAIKNHLKEFCKNIDIYTWGNVVYKKRYIQDNQKLFETYKYEKKIKSKKVNISDYDLVIIADFGHGFIDKQVRDRIQDEANFIALNVQSNSGNMGMSTINKYSKWDYICIDEIELRLACSNQFEELESLIYERFNGINKIVSITESKKGSHVYKNKRIIKSPSLAKEIVDTVGAGDAYFSLTSPLAYLDCSEEMIGIVGNIAGAIACSYQGNKYYVSKKRILEMIETL